MALFNDVYCQICDRFITKKHWNKHLYSSRHLNREINGYWPAFFPQKIYLEMKVCNSRKFFER